MGASSQDLRWSNHGRVWPKGPESKGHGEQNDFSSVGAEFAKRRLIFAKLPFISVIFYSYILICVIP